MNKGLKAKMKLGGRLDGSVPPAEQLPEGLLVRAALVADRVAHALKLAREPTHLTAKELAERRGLSKGRLSKIENGALNPVAGTLAKQADAPAYDVTVVLTPREHGNIHRSNL